MNKVLLTGNLTRDPEVRHIPASGNVVANFGMAMNERWNDARSGEQRDSVCFVEIAAWNRQAEIIGEYFKKGSPILVEGSLKFEQWEDDQGTNRNRLRVRLQRFEFFSNVSGENPQADAIEQPENTEQATDSTSQATDPVPQVNESTDDDVPF